MANEAPLGYSHDRRDETATPLCGAHRPNKTNPLLIKPALGNVKGTVYDLPSKSNLQHEYGLRQERDGTSSAEVLGNWAAHEPNPNVVPGRDFKQLNKHAVVEGRITCKDMADFRKTHDFRLKYGSDKPAEKKPYDATTHFGRATNTTDNFNDLFSHSYRCASPPPLPLPRRRRCRRCRPARPRHPPARGWGGGGGGRAGE